MIKYSFFCLIIFISLLSSCATMKWKRNYVNNKISTFLKTYTKDSSFDITLPTNLMGKSVRLSTRKQLKKNINALEKAFALIPDSINNNNVERVDSFYTNENKIVYIKQHNLQSKDIHFLE